MINSLCLRAHHGPISISPEVPGVATTASTKPGEPGGVRYICGRHCTTMNGWFMVETPISMDDEPGYPILGKLCMWMKLVDEIDEKPC